MASFNLPREMVYRPCVVDGKKAIFHRWALDEEVLIKFNGFIKNDRLSVICQSIREDRIVPPNTETEKLTNTYGIVEFEDGTVRGVRPVEIRFLDSEGLFRDYDWRKNDLIDRMNELRARNENDRIFADAIRGKEKE